MWSALKSARTSGRSAARRLLAPALAIVAAISFVSDNRAQSLSETNPTIVRPGPDGSVVRRIELGIGKSFIFDLPRDAKEVFVANPKVANAIVRSSRKIFIIGVADGATTVFVLDHEGRQIATAEIAIGRDMNILRKLLRTAMPGATINVVPVGDSIVLTGTVDSAAEASQALDIAKGFIGISAIGGGTASVGGAAGGTSISIGGGTVVEGKVINSLAIRGRDQVMLKVVVAEVQRAVIKQFGVNANAGWQIGKFKLGATLDNPFPIQLKDPTQTDIGIGGNGFGFNVRAFERAGVMRTLAEPTLTAISGESAKFTAGGEIPAPKTETCTPIPGTAQLTCQIGFEYKPYGVSLVFQPIVLSGGRISMRVATEVTEIDAENQIRGQFTTVPSFRVRKSDTTIELPSGASLVTAGLIQHSQKQIVNGLPALMNIPVLGALFRSRDYQKLETELMIIVTPFIAKPSNAADIARPDEGMAEPKDPQTILMGRLTKIYGAAGKPNDGGRYRGHVGFIAD